MNESEKPASLRLTGWSGPFSEDVLVVGETPTRYRITPAHGHPIRLAGRMRILQNGATTLVPKHAIRFTKEPTDG